ncbi:MFS transporter [Cutibacterium avidum]|uniref:MFS transporter n=1 Tax=Cutibacterium avidum TaxID=33010 RepID=A0A3E2DF10_9ACTN|nr:MFS transporter [Cutibacterium avidum]MBS5745718.1 MHS family MFS transporter [Propionibacterium sp.]MDU7816898.1 MFS transporter [Bacillota bacterium]MDK7358719.1 MFS transporter [Cutibacterium avidum]MDK7372699.1 MFS transporter [Cutibacterium avidum]MDU2072642.1 MFS transporter [Cutibacterium avidum]
MSSPIPLSEEPTVDQATVRRAALAGLIGTMLEQYDFVIYGTASAIIFNTLFFPRVSPAVGVIASMATYAVGFAARPLGSLFFARFGDRMGRKWVMIATLFLMGTATFCIGLIPSYYTIGIWAPIMLLILRIMQGFGAGAEQAGGVTLLAETVKRSRRGLYCALVFAGAALGSVLGAVAWIVAQSLTDHALNTWGWRAVFWTSAVVTVAAYILRRHLAESPVFQETQAARIGRDDTPIGDVLRHGRPALWRIFLINMGSNAQSYIYQVFMGSYLVTWLGMKPKFIPNVLLIGALASCIFTVFSGWMTDRVGRKPVIISVLVFLFLFPIPAFAMLNTKNPVFITIAVVLGFMIAGYGTVGSQGAFYAEMFGSRYRYAGISLAREFSSVFGGGIAPLVCSALVTKFAGSWWPVAVYMMVFIGLSLIAAIASPETRGRDLRLEQDAVGKPVEELSVEGSMAS